MAPAGIFIVFSICLLIMFSLFRTCCGPLAGQGPGGYLVPGRFTFHPTINQHLTNAHMVKHTTHAHETSTFGTMHDESNVTIEHDYSCDTGTAAASNNDC